MVVVGVIALVTSVKSRSSGSGNGNGRVVFVHIPLQLHLYPYYRTSLDWVKIVRVLQLLAFSIAPGSLMYMLVRGKFHESSNEHDG